MRRWWHPAPDRFLPVGACRLLPEIPPSVSSVVHSLEVSGEWFPLEEGGGGDTGVWVITGTVERARIKLM